MTPGSSRSEPLPRGRAPANTPVNMSPASVVSRTSAIWRAGKAATASLGSVTRDTRSPRHTTTGPCGRAARPAATSGAAPSGAAPSVLLPAACAVAELGGAEEHGAEPDEFDERGNGRREIPHARGSDGTQQMIASWIERPYHRRRQDTPPLDPCRVRDTVRHRLRRLTLLPAPGQPDPGLLRLSTAPRQPGASAPGVRPPTTGSSPTARGSAPTPRTPGAPGAAWRSRSRRAAEDRVPRLDDVDLHPVGHLDAVVMRRHRDRQDVRERVIHWRACHRYR